MEVHYTLPGIDFPVLVSFWNEKNFSNVTLFDRECAARVSLAASVCACVLLFKKTGPGCWHPEESAVDISEEIGTHVTHSHTHIHSVFSMSGQWRGSEGWVECRGWSVKWGREAAGCADSRGVKRWKTATEVRGRQKCWTSGCTERSVIRPRHRETSYHLLWFWAGSGRWGGCHPSVCTPAPAARTSCIFGDPRGAPSRSPLHLPPEHWGDLLSPSHCTTPGHRHTDKESEK